MILENQNFLFFTRTMKLGGTENVILQLCEILKPIVHKIVVCSCGGVNIEKLDDMGIKHYQIPDIENKNPKVILKVSATIKDIVRKENITVIHTHHRMAAFYVSLLQLYKKCHFVNTSHNTFNSKMKLTRFAYRNARLIACGNMVKKNLVNFFKIPDSQVCVIHNAVKKFEDEVCSLEVLQERRKHGNVLIGNIGRLSKQKGMEYFIEAAAIVLKTNINVSFFIIGDGEDREKLVKLVQEKKIQNNVFF